MSDIANSIQAVAGSLAHKAAMPSALGALVEKAGANIADAIGQASEKTGVDFSYLLQQAKAESGFRANIKAKTSSASGLYQFIEKTWLSMVDKYGEKHGINTNGMSKAQILAMRNDPVKASAMAAEFAGENKRFLDSHWGGKVGSTELYFAHFLGAGQASSFLKAKDENPLQRAADLFPQAAKANKNVFYDSPTGRAKSLNEVYAFFDKKFAIKGEDGKAYDGSSLYAQAVVQGNNVQTGEAEFAAFSPAEKDTSIISTKPKRTSPVINSYNSLGAYKSLVVNPIEIMLMSKLDLYDSKKS